MRPEADMATQSRGHATPEHSMRKIDSYTWHMPNLERTPC
jgi:hypothetical protein